MQHPRQTCVVTRKINAHHQPAWLDGFLKPRAGKADATASIEGALAWAQPQASDDGP
jgi:hypothetical protein